MGVIAELCTAGVSLAGSAYAEAGYGCKNAGNVTFNGRAAEDVLAFLDGAEDLDAYKIVVVKTRVDYYAVF